MDEKQTCQNCKFYLEHYIKKPTGYYPIGGHCINNEFDLKKRKKFQTYDDCNFWQSDESKKAEDILSLKRILNSMSETIKNIYEVLKDVD